MKRVTLTIPDLATQMENIYRQLVGSGCYQELLRLKNATGELLRLLRAVAGGNTCPLEMTTEQQDAFLESILNCVGLQYATGSMRSLFGPLEIEESGLLGRANDRRSQLRSPDDSLADWYFHILVQAWAAAQGFGPLADLRFGSSFKGKEVCDFAIDDSAGAVELVECKRVHPFYEPRIFDLEKTVDKISARALKAVNQLETTREYFDNVRAEHWFIDFSNYQACAHQVRLKTGTMEVIGFSEEEAKQVREAVLNDVRCLQKIDRITFCWRNMISIASEPIALVQKAFSVPVTPSSQTLLNYSGWTVAAYPRESSKMRELRVSSTARELAWIKTTFNMLSNPQNFLRFGPVETCDAE